jgi:RNA recognition motif-containing protein
VSFSKHEDAKKAVDEGSKMQIKINNNAVIVMPHIYKKDNELFKGQKQGGANPIVKNQKEAFKSNIFVRFIPKDTTEEQIREKFS